MLFNGQSRDWAGSLMIAPESVWRFLIGLLLLFSEAYKNYNPACLSSFSFFGYLWNY